MLLSFFFLQLSALFVLILKMIKGILVNLKSKICKLMNILEIQHSQETNKCNIQNISQVCVCVCVWCGAMRREVVLWVVCCAVGSVSLRCVVCGMVCEVR